MRRLLLVLVPLALLAAGSGAIVHSPSRSSCKPVAPIDLEAALVGDPGSPFGVTARASSRSGDDVDLEIVLPNGVTHVGGERKVRGPRGDLRVDFRADDRSRKEILVRATITREGARLTKVVPLVIFDGAPRAPKGRPARDRQGRPILEFSP